MDTAALIARLESPPHEGLRLRIYVDTTGRDSIGIGRNLSDDGITAEEARLLCTNDVARAVADLDRNTPWWHGLSETRQQVLAELAFMLGWPRLATFHQMLAALARGDWAEATVQLLDSDLARELPARIGLLAKAMKTDSFTAPVGVP